MRIETIVCGMLGENAYLVFDEDRQDALIIDPGDGLPSIRAALEACGRQLTYIVLTHGHFDHMLSAGRLREETGARLLIGARDAAYLKEAQLNMFDMHVARLSFEPCDADQWLDEGPIEVAGLPFDVLLTPGHTPGGLCLMHRGARALFTGDTLFAAGFGRIDLPGGNVDEMRRSLKRLLSLPDDLTAYPGHGASENLGEIKGAWRN